MSVFKRSAEQYLGITSDLINTNIDATTVYVTGDLQVTGTISSGGSTGATGSGDLEVTGDLIVDQHSYLNGAVNMSGGMGCTGSAIFYGNLIGRSFLFGISPYFYVSYNKNIDLQVNNGSSIIYGLYTSDYETYSVNGIIPSFGGTTSTYIQPVNTALYEISFFGRGVDTANILGLTPYYYAQDLSPASYIVSSSYPEWIVPVDGDRRPFCYSQILLLNSQYRFDLRAAVNDFIFQWGSLCVRLISTI